MKIIYLITFGILLNFAKASNYEESFQPQTTKHSLTHIPGLCKKQENYKFFGAKIDNSGFALLLSAFKQDGSKNPAELKKVAKWMLRKELMKKVPLKDPQNILNEYIKHYHQLISDKLPKNNKQIETLKSI